MTNIEETQLPGVGVRQDFVTKGGRRIGVIAHRGGHRDLLIYATDDPDRCRETVRLEDQDSRALADMLGSPHVGHSMAELQQSVEGLTIDWLPVREGSACAGATIGDLEVRRRTGVTIVAVIRGADTLPSPDPDFRLRPGDTAVVIGTPEGIQRAFGLLRGT